MASVHMFLPECVRVYECVCASPPPSLHLAPGVVILHSCYFLSPNNTASSSLTLLYLILLWLLFFFLSLPLSPLLISPPSLFYFHFSPFPPSLCTVFVITQEKH